MLRVVEEAHRTDTGRQRHVNEDAFFARAPLYAVADGMGGAQAGEVAARMATAAFDEELPDGSSPEQTLRDAVRRANRQIHARASQAEEEAGMGTTLTAAMVGEGEVTIAHVGDSRAYVFRDGSLRRLTHDHSLVDVLVRQGRLTPEQAENHPQRSIITRALGPEPDVDVDTQTVSSRDGDVFLLCSDGLTTMVDEAQIAAALGPGRPLESAVDDLVNTANRAGGRDNITVVAFRVEEVEVRGAGGADPADTADTDTSISAEEVREAVRQEERQRATPAEPSPRPAAAPVTAEGTTGGRLTRRLLGTVVALAVLGALAAGAYFGIRTIHFLGTDGAGRVALYRGLPYELPGGLDLYSKRYASPIQTRSLPPRRRRAVREHELRSRSDAADLIRDIERSEGLR